jgi:riboflavin synthase
VFTGIVEEVGQVLAWRRGAADTLRIGASRVLADARPGDSVAVDGACLTVTALDADWFEAGLAPETLRRTSLGQRQPGEGVNRHRPGPLQRRPGRVHPGGCHAARQADRCPGEPGG